MMLEDAEHFHGAARSATIRHGKPPRAYRRFARRFRPPALFSLSAALFVRDTRTTLRRSDELGWRGCDIDDADDDAA